LGNKMKILRHILAILLIFLVVSSLAAFLAGTDSQPDLISRQTGFIAPVIGPWSFLLPPHASKTTPLDIYWKRVFTAVFLAALVSTSIISTVTKKKWVRIVVHLAGYAVIVFWCLTGLFRVFLELVMT
jgi:hypothetical protein